MRSRRVVAAVAALALMPLLAACGQNAYEDTRNQQPSGNGAFMLSNSIYAQNVVLVPNTDNSKFAVVGTFVNLSGTPDNLVAVQIDPNASNGNPVPDKVDGTPVALPANASVLTGVRPADAGYVGPTQNSAPLTISYSTTPSTILTPGSYVWVKVAYQRNGIARMHVLIVPAAGYYAKFAPDTAG